MSLRFFDIIRARDRQWGLAVVILLLASWLSIYCTNCFAAAETTHQHDIQSASAGPHCMEPPQSQDGNENTRDSSCVYCNTAMAAVPAKFPDIRENIFKLSFDAKYFISNNELDYLNNVNVAIDIFPAYEKPERAYFLPFARYTVLLN